MHQGKELFPGVRPCLHILIQVLFTPPFKSFEKVGFRGAIVCDQKG